MEISDDVVKEFQDAYEVDFGETVTESEARDMLLRLVLLYERLARPLPEMSDDMPYE
jgi:hypothetical protein